MSFSRLYRGVLFIVLGAMSVAGGAAAAWFVLGQFGYHVPFGLVAGVVALAFAWSVATSGSGTPPPAPPRPAAPPQLTRSQLEALVLLRRGGADHQRPAERGTRWPDPPGAARHARASDGRSAVKPAGELWTTQQVADLLGFSTRTIQRWTKDGKLGALVYRVGVRSALAVSAGRRRRLRGPVRQRGPRRGRSRLTTEARFAFPGRAGDATGVVHAGATIQATRATDAPGATATIAHDRRTWSAGAMSGFDRSPGRGPERWRKPVGWRSTRVGTSVAGTVRPYPVASRLPRQFLMPDGLPPPRKPPPPNKVVHDGTAGPCALREPAQPLAWTQRNSNGRPRAR